MARKNQQQYVILVAVVALIFAVAIFYTLGSREAIFIATGAVDVDGDGFDDTAGNSTHPIDCDDNDINTHPLVNGSENVISTNTTLCGYSYINSWINVTTSNVILDGNGTSLDGVDDTLLYGVFTKGLDGTIKNFNIKNYDQCIRTSGRGQTVYNNTISSCDKGMHLRGGGFVNPHNVSLNTVTDSRDGLDLLTNSGIYTNNTISNNTRFGIIFSNTRNDIFADVIFQENGFADFHIPVATTCNYTFSNVIGSGGNPVHMITDSSGLSDTVVSQLLVCGADGAVIDNITVQGSDTLNNNYILIKDTDGLVLSNINSSFNLEGIIVSEASNVLIRDSYFEGNLGNAIEANRGSTPSSTNITIINITAFDHDIGLFILIDNSTIKDSESYNNGRGAIQVNADNVLIMNNTLHDSNQGLQLASGLNANVTQNTVFNNVNAGIFVSGIISGATLDSNNFIGSGGALIIQKLSTGNVYNNNNFTGVSVAYFLQSGASGNFTNNNILDTSLRAFHFQNTTGSYLINNTIINASHTCHVAPCAAIAFTEVATDNFIEGNVIKSIDNTFGSLPEYGIFINESKGNIFTNNTVIDNVGEDIFIINSIDTLFTDTMFDDNITASFTGDNFTISSINLTVAPEDPVDNVSNISLYLNATNTTSTSFLVINISYNDSDIIAAGLDESTLKLYRYNGTAWVVIENSTVDTVNNFVFANITEFSIIAPFGGPPGAVTTTTKSSKGGAPVIIETTISGEGSGGGGTGIIGIGDEEGKQKVIITVGQQKDGQLIIGLVMTTKDQAFSLIGGNEVTLYDREYSLIIGTVGDQEIGFSINEESYRVSTGSSVSVDVDSDNIEDYKITLSSVVDGIAIVNIRRTVPSVPLELDQIPTEVLIILIVTLATLITIFGLRQRKLKTKSKKKTKSKNKTKKQIKKKTNRKRRKKSKNK